jgi:tellurite resistance protein
MRIIQLINQESQELLGLYLCNKTEEELSASEVDEVMCIYNDMMDCLPDDGDEDKANAYLKEEGFERIYVEQEVYV